MTAWSLIHEAFDPSRERFREALCTLGNGYFATRGAAAESSADAEHYPGTYVAGCYNRLVSQVAGEALEDESLVNVPNWLPLTVRPGGGQWLDLRAVDILDYRQELDMRAGELRRRVRFRDRDGRVTALSERRLVHARHRHVAALRLELVPENWWGPIDIRSALDGTVTNAGVARYGGLDGRHLMPVAAELVDDHTQLLRVRTVDSRIEIAQGARIRMSRDGVLPTLEDVHGHRQDDLVSHQYRVDLREGQMLAIEKVVTLFTSRDHGIYECGHEALRLVAELPSYESLFESHRGEWDILWRRFGIELDAAASDSRRTECILRLHLFHLLQTASPAAVDLDAGIPARGLHGEAYRGHVFWDELFVFPLFNLRMPEITRALLLYRYRRLEEARRAARAAGLRGAMYPWQSGSNGREESQRLHLNPKSGRWIADHSWLQRHVGAAVAYNVWQHYQATRDVEFLATYGGEMIVEIARFWASIARFDEQRQRFLIEGVMGPDEYHDGYPGASMPGIDNNAYTNLMAVWVLRRALSLPSLLGSPRWEDLGERLGIDPAEPARWREIAQRMFVPFHDGMISQFDGYEALEELDWDGLRARYADIQRLDRILEMEGDSVNRYKASKQADVLMLFYLFSAEELTELITGLGYDFDPATIPATVRYYLRRTSDGSTLSRVVHAWVLARSDRPAAWRIFCHALESDVGDVQGGTTEEGIHIGAMAGTVDLVQRCFTGIEMRSGVLWLNPCLPAPIARLRMPINYQGRWLTLEVADDRTTVRAGGGEEPLRLVVYGRAESIAPESCRTFVKPRGPGGTSDEQGPAPSSY